MPNSIDENSGELSLLPPGELAQLLAQSPIATNRANAVLVAYLTATLLRLQKVETDLARLRADHDGLVSVCNERAAHGGPV